MKAKRKRITIISRESDDKTLDIAMLEAELLERGCDVTVLSKLLTKEKSIRALGYAGHVARQEAAILASDVVVLDTYCIPASMIPHRKGTKVVQMWHALGAVKKFGWQTVGKEGGSSERVARLMKMHRGYDYVVCPSDVTAAHFCEAFDVSRDKIVRYGLPRVDYIKSVAAGERREDMRKKILARYPALSPETAKSDDSTLAKDAAENGVASMPCQRPAQKKVFTKGYGLMPAKGPAKGYGLISAKSSAKGYGLMPAKGAGAAEDGASDSYAALRKAYDALYPTARKTVLYAPTFRKGKAVDVQSLIDALDPDKYDLVVKLHPLYRGGEADSLKDDVAGALKDDVAGAVKDDAAGALKDNAGRLNVIYDEEFSSYDWLSVADIVISDYSSFVIEATLADKPLFIYAYDLEDYEANTGLNMDFAEEPIAPYVFSDAESLAVAAGGDYDMDALHAFRDRYIDIDTGDCTKDLADFIISIA